MRGIQEVQVLSYGKREIRDVCEGPSGGRKQANTLVGYRDRHQKEVDKRLLPLIAFNCTQGGVQL